MKIYMEVTKDKYELPVKIADSIAELAADTNHTESSMASIISRNKKKMKKGERVQFIEVEIDETDE